MVLENFVSLIDWLICEHDAQHKKNTLCSTQWDRFETDGLLIADSYKYTWISNKIYKGLSATLLPSVSVCNPGIVVCHMESIPEYWSATE